MATKELEKGSTAFIIASITAPFVKAPHISVNDTTLQRCAAILRVTGSAEEQLPTIPTHIQELQKNVINPLLGALATEARTAQAKTAYNAAEEQSKKLSAELSELITKQAPFADKSKDLKKYIFDHIISLLQTNVGPEEIEKQLTKRIQEKAQLLHQLKQYVAPFQTLDQQFLSFAADTHKQLSSSARETIPLPKPETKLTI